MPALVLPFDFIALANHKKHCFTGRNWLYGNFWTDVGAETVGGKLTRLDIAATLVITATRYYPQQQALTSHPRTRRRSFVFVHTNAFHSHNNHYFYCHFCMYSYCA